MNLADLFDLLPDQPATLTVRRVPAWSASGVGFTAALEVLDGGPTFRVDARTSTPDQALRDLAAFIRSTKGHSP